jgi:hypothetical protein
MKLTVVPVTIKQAKAYVVGSPWALLSTSNS